MSIRDMTFTTFIARFQASHFDPKSSNAVALVAPAPAMFLEMFEQYLSRPLDTSVITMGLYMFSSLTKNLGRLLRLLEVAR